MAALQDFGIALILVFQRMSPALDGIMEFFTFFGTVNFFMIFIPLIYWTINKRWGFRAFMVLLFSDIVGVSFKLWLHQPRPYWISEEVQLLQSSGESSYGIISTHASNPPAVLGYLALQVRKRWMWIAAIAAPLLISFSRMYLGVHFPHDILAGWISGLLVLFLFVKTEDRVSASLKSKSIGYKIGLSLIISLIFIAAGLAISAAIAGTPDPSSYAAYSEDARSIDHFFTLAGALFGAMSGWFLMKEKAPFDVTGPLAQKAVRYVLGMVGVIVVLFGLDFAFDAVQAGDVVAYSLRYTRYGLTTFWAMFGAPWMFLKLKLAQVED